MGIERNRLYRFPWSKTDNPGGWVEVTDQCDISCPGCYRHNLKGHRTLEEVKEDILNCQRITNCDMMAVAGGEPLIYPHIVEVVDFISHRKIKPVILTNGEKLTWEMASDLKKAGLAKFHFHVDSLQERPGWAGKTEPEMNKLRQRFADLIWELGGVQCGYNLTVFRSTLKYLPEIVEWCRKNIRKVQHISLIAFRAIPLTDQMEYMVNGNKVDLSHLQNRTTSLEEIGISTEEMYGLLEDRFADFRACSYLNGTTSPETYKYLIAVHVGSPKRIYGTLGPRTVELSQAFYHLFKGKYSSFQKTPKVGKKIFLLSILDGKLRKAFKNFLKAVTRNPLEFFQGIYIQSIHLQQPVEIHRGKVNLCDGCANMTVYQGRLINSCRLDDYRLFGGLITPIMCEDAKIQERVPK
jgi:organic radical activating enzyme